MKLALTLLLTICIASGAWIPINSSIEKAPEFTVLSSEGANTVIEVKIHGIEVTEEAIDGKVYKVVSLPGDFAPYDDVVGHPQVPTVPGVIAIPERSIPGFEVVEANYIEINDIDLMPFQPPTTDAAEVYPFTIDQQVYWTNDFFPRDQVQFVNTGYFRDLWITQVKMKPVTYNPVTKTLRVYTSLKVRVKHPGSFSTKIIEPEFAGLYRECIKNYPFLPVVEGRTDEQGVRYLVFTKPTYEPTVAPLIDWHHQQGVETRIIQKSSFTYSEIKDSIQNEYDNHTPAKLMWVLLVGDINDMPTYTLWGVPASDVWYVDFDLNHYAELSIGRFSCDSPIDLSNQVDKTMKFIQDPEMGPWLEKSVLVAHEENYPLKYSECKRQIHDFNYGFYDPTMDTLMGALSGGTNAAVKTAIEEGRVLVNYRGHGSSGCNDWVGWDYNNASWTSTNVMSLNNGDKTPVVLNICCWAGNIIMNDCLNEVWLEKYPGGGVASWSASEPSYTIPNHSLDRAFYWAFYDNTAHGTPYTPPMWSIGWVGIYADYYMVAYGGSGGTTNYRMYLWCGDPALELWRGQPADPLVSHPTSIPTGNQNFTVTVDDSRTPIEDALVCVWKGSEVYEYGWTNASGQVTFNITPATIGTMYVTASPHNFIPYQGTCDVYAPGVIEEEVSFSYGIWLKSTIANRGLVISYALPENDQLKIKIYDAIGRKIISRNVKISGKGSISVPTDKLTSGIYFVRLQSNGQAEEGQFLILR